MELCLSMKVAFTFEARARGRLKVWFVWEIVPKTAGLIESSILECFMQIDCGLIA